MIQIHSNKTQVCTDYCSANRKQQPLVSAVLQPTDLCAKARPWVLTMKKRRMQFCSHLKPPKSDLSLSLGHGSTQTPELYWSQGCLFTERTRRDWASGLQLPTNTSECLVHTQKTGKHWKTTHRESIFPPRVAAPARASKQVDMLNTNKASDSTHQIMQKSLKRSLYSGYNTNETLYSWAFKRHH